MIKILVVDDENDVRERLANIVVKKLSCYVDTAANGQEALEKLRQEKFDIVILDIKMPGLSGIDVIRQAVKFTPQTKFLAVSAYDSQDAANEALKAGAIDFIHKPQTNQAIELKLRDILTKIGKIPPTRS